MLIHQPILHITLTKLVVKAVKSLALNIREHGKVLYQKPQLKFMAHAVHPCCTAYCNVLAQCPVATQHKQTVFSGMSCLLNNRTV